MIPQSLGLALPWQSERIGPAFASGRVLAKLPAAWWMNYLHDHLADARYVPMVWAVQEGAAFSDAALAAQQDRERYWLLGNEPDRADQSNTSPHSFVKTLRRWPSRAVLVPGVTLDEGGLAWFREFVGLWRNQVGAIPKQWMWAVHCYPGDGVELNERWTAFRRVLVELRCHRPTVITEFACYREGLQLQVGALDAGLKLMQNDRYLAGICWFSARYGQQKTDWERSDLLDATGNWTQLGRVFAARARSTT